MLNVVILNFIKKRNPGPILSYFEHYYKRELFPHGFAKILDIKA